MARIRQSRPDSGLGFQVKILKTFNAVPQDRLVEQELDDRKGQGSRLRARLLFRLQVLHSSLTGCTTCIVDFVWSRTSFISSSLWTP